jgi:hypothetical protein
MDRLRKAALLTRLIEQLRQNGSWCGETHVQKSTLFLQDLMRVPLGFDFILYKHGPFSFDLRDELTSLRADELVKLEPQRHYGPRMATTDQSKYIQGIYSKTLERYDDSISFVAEKLGGKGVADLERLATALYVTQRADIGTSIDTRAAKLTALKPHIARDDAVAAAREVDQIIEEAKPRAKRPPSRSTEHKVQ